MSQLDEASPCPAHTTRGAKATEKTRLRLGTNLHAGPLLTENIFLFTRLLRQRSVAVDRGPTIGSEIPRPLVGTDLEVALFEAADCNLLREKRDAAEKVARALGRDEVNIQCGANIERIERKGGFRQRVLHAGGRANRVGVRTVPRWRGPGSIKPTVITIPGHRS